MSRRVIADLDLEIDGQRAKFTGAGRHMRLQVEEARTLRKFLQVSLPNLKRAGASFTPTEVPAMLAREGLTVEVADRSGPLFILGEGAGGRGYTVPGFGRVDSVTLANKRAAFRLASSTGPSWLLPAIGVSLIILAAVLVTRRSD